MNRSADPVSPRELFHNPSRLAQKVGRRIKAVRLEQGLSRRDFGEKLGVSGQQIQKYEIGQDAVPLHRLLKLASMCGVSPQAFWGEGNTEGPHQGGFGAADDIKSAQLVRAYKRINDAKVKRSLLQLVKQMAGDEGESASS
jgi:transcriptional regulator with XRE-family HTH domain